ncbi:hypothetical protein [Paenibacillus sinopodophylli]|uniref:hypothetical protein n=1 Tax=Paenibacillus sinopodophylli TaxID=1837342 RepID=UPI00110CFCD1|nr:hypothetical protein [Paenibacillus sinopodophylli]
MFEFIDWLITNRNKPLDYIFLAAIVFIIDRFGRNLITSQVKRLFHVDDKSEFKQYIQNQQRIEEKLELLLQKEGITWTAPTSQQSSEDTVSKRSRLSLPLSEALSLVRVVKQFIIYWRFKMSNINKGILFPLLAAIASFIKSTFGYEIPDDTLNGAADLILLLIMVIGIFIKPKNEKPQQEEVDGYYH